MTSADFQTLLPEIVLAGYAMAALMAAVYTTKDRLAPLLVWSTAGLFVALALFIGAGGEGVDPGLGDVEPFRHANLLTDQRLKFIGLGHRILPLLLLKEVGRPAP